MANSNFFGCGARLVPKLIVGLLALLVTLLSEFFVGCNIKPFNSMASEALPSILEPADHILKQTVQMGQRTASASAIAGALIQSTRTTVHQKKAIQAAESNEEPR